MIKTILQILIKFLQSKLGEAETLDAVLLAKYPELPKEDLETICEIIIERVNASKEEVK